MKSLVGLQALIVDDEESIREILEEEFKDMGFEVSTAANGLFAIDQVKKQKFDLIISDIKMPEMNGPAFLRWLRENKDIEQPKFVFITGGVNMDLTDDDSDISKMFDGLMHKPFDFETLEDELKRIIFGTAYKATA